MRLVIAGSLGFLLFSGCADQSAEVASPAAVATSSKPSVPSSTPQAIEQSGSEPVAAPDSSPPPAVNENHEQGSWMGQIALGQPVSMFNYVGAESGDFAPMRFRNDSESGKKILAMCSDGQMCEFTGAVEWLDEAPPPDASAIGQIVRVDSVRRATTATP